MDSKFKVGTKVKIIDRTYMIAVVGQNILTYLYNMIDIESGKRWFGNPIEEDDFLNELKEIETYYGLEVVKSSDLKTSEPSIPLLPFVAGDLIHCRHKGLGWQAIKEVVAILQVTDSIEVVNEKGPVVVLGHVDSLRRQSEKSEILFLNEIEILDIYKRQPVPTAGIAKSE